MPAVVSYCRLTNNRLGDNFPANSLSAASLPSLLKRGLVKLSVACMGVDVGNPARNGFLPLLSVAVLLLVSSAAGQAVYGSVFGTVTDPSGAALPKASIIVTSVERASSTKGVTNDSGNYSVAQLLPGHYTVKAEAPGFRSSSVTDVPVHVDQTSRVDLRLAIGMVTEGITVSAKDVPLLKTDRTDVAVTFSQREILDVPLRSRTTSPPWNCLPRGPPFWAGSTLPARTRRAAYRSTSTARTGVRPVTSWTAPITAIRSWESLSLTPTWKR